MLNLSYVRVLHAGQMPHLLDYLQLNGHYFYAAKRDTDNHDLDCVVREGNVDPIKERLNVNPHTSGKNGFENHSVPALVLAVFNDYSIHTQR